MISSIAALVFNAFGWTVRARCDHTASSGYPARAIDAAISLPTIACCWRKGGYSEKGRVLTIGQPASIKRFAE